jgi:microcystin-dependent protein
MPGEPFIGEIFLVPYNFAPRGFAFCDGQLLLISQNTALFSLLGTMYGGDGRTNFALPDLRGRFPLGEGSGPGLTNRPLGEKGGREIEIVEGRPPILGWGSTNEIGKKAPDGSSVAPGAYMPPYLTLNYVIALVGIFPSRN